MLFLLFRGRFLCLRLGRCLHDKILYALGFFFEASGEIVRAVFEEHDETESEEREKNEPEQPPKQRHRATVAQPTRRVNAEGRLIGRLKLPS